MTIVLRFCLKIHPKRLITLGRDSIDQSRVRVRRVRADYCARKPSKGFEGASERIIRRAGASTNSERVPLVRGTGLIVGLTVTTGREGNYSNSCLFVGRKGEVARGTVTYHLEGCYGCLSVPCEDPRGIEGAIVSSVVSRKVGVGAIEGVVKRRGREAACGGCYCSEGHPRRVIDRLSHTLSGGCGHGGIVSFPGKERGVARMAENGRG